MSLPTPPYWVVPRTIRRTIIIALGVVSLVIGGNLLASGEPPATIRFLGALPIPLQTWGALWLAAGVTSIVGAWVPETNDRWGLDVLSGMFALWAGLHLWATITGRFDAGPGLILNMACLLIVLAVADMPRINPPDQPDARR